MSIFNRNPNKRKFGKKFDRLKKRAIVAKTMHKVTIIRVMSIFMVGLLVVGGGAIGISTIIPDNISKTSSANDSDMLSVDKDVNANTVTSHGAVPSGSAVKVNPKSSNSGDINNSGLVVDAKAAVLMDAGSGTVLFSQNGAERLPPASVTKVMTMLLAMEAIDRGQVKLTDMVTISERAASMGGSQMYMEPGEQHPLEDLMKGISMVSANDACVAFKKGIVWEKYLYS